MKKISLVLVAVLVFMCCISSFSFAENEVISSNIVANEITVQNNAFLQKAVKVMDKVTWVALPVCVLALAWGTVQYFIMGIRNLYKKKQGLILMFSSMTFYVILVVISFVLTLIAAGDFNNDSIDISQAVVNVEETADVALDGVAEVVLNVLEYITEWSLPFCAILIAWGAVQYFIVGIRNLYKKRQGLLLMFGSIAFLAIIIVLNFAMQIIF